MNERIRDLQIQAFTECKTFDDDKVRTDEVFERFAELIVRECVHTLIDNTPERYINEAAEEDWDRGYDRAMRDCVHHIQEHFGVEE